MNLFQQYLDTTKEIGYVQELLHSIVTVTGLPSVRLFEKVVFETGEIGQVIGLRPDAVEILLFEKNNLRVDTRVVRTKERVSISVGKELLGHTVDALGKTIGSDTVLSDFESRGIDAKPPGIMSRTPINRALETGVGLVDLLIPLGKGQRQLVIGDRKTGKSTFLRQLLVTQARQGSVCIYATIGKQFLEIKQLEEFVVKHNIAQQTVIVSSRSADPSGLVFLTPYTAMTIAEYFRDQGKDVVVIIDDLTTHATVYREITLLAKRFPGRGSYPGDIFYTHARLMERAGSFAVNGNNVAISCFPVAQSVMGDLAAFITTNIMSMTDGHLFFDTQLFDQGKRPAVNPFISVTRVGLEAQTPLVKDLSRQLLSFLVSYQQLEQYTHFGAEVSKNVQESLKLGETLFILFQQLPDQTRPLSLTVYFLGLLWSGFWSSKKPADIKKEIQTFIDRYSQVPEFTQLIDQTVHDASNFGQLVEGVKNSLNAVVPFLTQPQPPVSDQEPVQGVYAN